MNTKLLLVLIVFLAGLSTISSATALFLVMKKQSDYQLLDEEGRAPSSPNC